MSDQYNTRRLYPESRKLPAVIGRLGGDGTVPFASRYSKILNLIGDRT